MSVEETENLALKYDLILLIEPEVSKEFIEEITEHFKGLKPREANIQTEEQWYNNYRSSIPVYKQFIEIYDNLLNKIIQLKSLKRQDAENGLIGAFRLIQERYLAYKNMNGYKVAAIKTLLRDSRPIKKRRRLKTHSQIEYSEYPSIRTQDRYTLIMQRIQITIAVIASIISLLVTLMGAMGVEAFGFSETLLIMGGIGGMILFGAILLLYIFRKSK